MHVLISDFSLLQTMPTASLCNGDSHRLAQNVNPQHSQNNANFRYNPREKPANSRWSERCTALISEFSLLQTMLTNPASATEAAKAVVALFPWM